MIGDVFWNKTMTHKTQCPHCQTIYPVPESKIHDKKLRANCGKCKNSFLVVEHLVVPDLALIQDGEEDDDLNIPRIPIRPKKSKRIVAKEGMIFDDMQTEDDPIGEISMEGIEDFINTQIDSRPFEASTQNKASYEDDEAWLHELTKETPKPATPIHNSSPSDDLSELLGADLNTLIPSAKARPKTRAITQPAVESIPEEFTAKRSLGSLIVWSLGCLLMIALLGVQYVFFNADSVAKTDKAPLINKLCKNCLSHADSNALNTNYVLQPGQVQFTTNLIGTINNPSMHDQLYPNLKITVYGNHGMIGDLALAPKDYLAIPQRLIGASSSGRFMLTLDAPTKDITSVSIEPFY